jgi:hypothetical protein
VILPALGDPLFPVTLRAVQRLRGQLDADRLAAELGCEVTPHPELPRVVEARAPALGVWLLAGTPDEVRAAARAVQMREWLACLGTLQRDA